MNTDRIEELLEQLVSKQDEISDCLHRIESDMSAQAQLSQSVDFNLSAIKDELNWWGEAPSFAKQLLIELGSIDSSARNIDANTSSLG